MADTTLLLFPEDIIYKILSRLPIKSLARFRCVCKLWLKYIDHPYLRTIHVKEEPTLLMLQNFPSYCFGEPNKIKISFLHGVKKDPALDLCSKNPSCCSIQIVGSCNGLVLVDYEQNPYDAGTYRFVVIDPLSKRRYCLPPVSFKIRRDGPCHAAGIGFDDSTNTFKTVFSFLKRRKVVCTLVHSSGMSSWRKVAQKPAYPISNGGVFSNGRLHWFTPHLKFGDYDYARKIVWFDVKTEEFGLPMDPPEGCHPKGSHCGFVNQLVDLNGEVGFVYIGPISIKLWILKHEEWVLHCSFDLGHILPEYAVYKAEVLGCWNKDGDILLTCDGRERLFVYTLKSGDLQQVELYDPEDIGFQYIVEMYQSSLFSVHTSAYYYST